MLIYTKYELLENVQDYRMGKWAALLIIAWIKTGLQEALAGIVQVGWAAMTTEVTFSLKILDYHWFPVACFVLVFF